MATAMQTTNGAPLTGAPACPKCGGRMWDNRQSKRNPKAPDFRCRDRSCDGRLWPGQHKAATPILTPRARGAAPAGEQGAGQGSARGDSGERMPAAPSLSPSLRSCYLDVTAFVLDEVRPRFAGAGVPCTDATLAAIAATLFIAASDTKRPRGEARGAA